MRCNNAISRDTAQKMNDRDLQTWASKLKSESEVREREERKKKLKIANERGSQVISLSRFVNSHNIMRLPLFSTKYVRNGRRTKPIVFNSQDGSVSFKVSGANGLPDQAEGNIVRYAISKARKIRRGVGVLPEYVEVTRYELLTALGRTTSGKSYKRLEDSLECLAGMQVTGNVFGKGSMYTGTLVSFEYTKTKNGRVDKIRIIFNSKLHKHLEEEKAVLAIPNEILFETNALRIRLLEVIQSGMGYQGKWMMKLSYLKELCAYDRELKYFKRDIGLLKLPYRLSFVKGENKEQIAVFTRKGSTSNTENS